MHRIKNSVAGMLLAGLVCPDARRARGYWTDARGQLLGKVERSTVANAVRDWIWARLG